MKIKLKLTLGVGVLFLLIIVLTVISTLYINALKKDTDNILIANYNTLEYSRNMILALDEMQNDPQAIAKFERNLFKQKQNETEPGETKVTALIEAHFNAFKKNQLDNTLKPLMRKDISELMRLNMQAIKHKSKVAATTAETATIWINIAGALCFIIAFVLLINLPGNIANPIKELTESIKQIAARNYHQRVHFQGHSEFGELAKSFNAMAEKLEEYAGSKLAEILMEKKRIDTLINNMHDAVIGLDENKKVLFANDETLKILAIRNEDIIGKNVLEVAKNNDLLRALIHDLERPPDTSKKLALNIYADNK